MKTHPHTPDSHSTNEVGASDLTTVELLWLEKRIENRVRLVGRFRRKSWTAIGACCLSLQAAFFAFVRWTSNDFGTSCPHRYFARGDTRATLFDRPLDHAGR